jgi:hypothetical protein
MQNRRSWEGGSPSELEDVCRRKVAVRSFIEASRSTYAEQIILPSNRATAADSSLQTVYDLAAKRRVGLRFNCKNLTSKCASLRFTDLPAIDIGDRAYHEETVLPSVRKFPFLS